MILHERDTKRKDDQRLFDSLGLSFIPDGDYNVKNNLWGIGVDIVKYREPLKAEYIIKDNIQTDRSYWSKQITF